VPDLRRELLLSSGELEGERLLCLSLRRRLDLREGDEELLDSSDLSRRRLCDDLRSELFELDMFSCCWARCSSLSCLSLSICWLISLFDAEDWLKGEESGAGMNMLCCAVVLGVGVLGVMGSAW
jgi:hypothetical protein